MTISERVCCLLDAHYMGQKEFSELTGIAQSTISDWNWKKTDPVSEKIVIICEDLGITPYELLNATVGKRFGTEEGKYDADERVWEKRIKNKL